jgi:hypothetical protein
MSEFNLCINHPPEGDKNTTKMKKKHLNWLQEYNACKESIRWIKQNNIQSLEKAWNICERGDWLLWMATRLSIDRRKLVLCAALYAHTIVQHMEDARSRDAVRIAFLWGRGKATDVELEKASDDAYAAVIAARTVDTATYAAVWAAVWATTFTDAIWAVNTIADASADKKSNQLYTAKIAKKVLTEDVLKKIKKIK